ncbi:hypothetical protein LguiA_012521 [Lonicera macranthoides]
MSGFGSDSAPANMSFHLPSPLMIDEESTEVIEKQGIVSILRCDGGRTKAPSLRRTLSADMSSKKWLAQNGFSSMKKIASSEHLAISGADSSDGEDEKDGARRQGHADVWSSILMQKAEEDPTKLLPLYVHPLVKKTASSLLSEKSLEVCTESLGSETGSDGFSSYSSSEAGDVDEEKEKEELVPLATPPQHQQCQQQQQLFFSEKEETVVVKTNYSASKKSQARSFPPPLPSLARTDGPSVHMHSHRKNGRLVLEAVSIPSNNFFQAKRQDGRLLLTLLNSPSEESVEAKGDQEEGKFEEYQDVFDIFDENGGKEEVDEEEEKEMGEIEIEKFEKENGRTEMRKATKMMSSRVINLHRSALSMKKLMGLENRNPTWTNKFNKGVKLVDAEEEDVVVAEQQQSNPLPQSLPPLARRLIPSPTGAAAASFNAYEYFWRAKPTANLIKPLTHQSPPLKTNNKVMVRNNCPKVYEQQEMVLLKANKALVPSLRGCKEPRRSLLLWEPYCIATS